MIDLLPIDPLFQVPFLTGLLIAGVVPLLGPLIRLRGEWLGALSYSQAAAAGGVVGAMLGFPALVLGVITAALAAALKAVLRREGNDFHGLLIIVGWTVMILTMANSAHGRFVGEALIDGQLYFADGGHLAGASVTTVGLLVLSALLARRLLSYSLFPGTASANRAPVRRHILIFDIAVAITLGMAASTMGIMAAFALALVPAWITFAFAASWRQAIWLGVVLSVAAYIAAFAMALMLDQPFGPVFTAMLVLLSPLRLLGRLRRSSGSRP